MRMKKTSALGRAACWIWRIIDVRMPMDKVYGLRTR
jgi:hypothetical protein